jgi:predicted MPP superfamily phosphohydrolase
MKRFFQILGIIIAIVIAYLIVLQLYPKNAGRFPFLVFLFFGDYYLWRSIREWVLRKGKAIGYLLTMLYWLPFGMLIVDTLLTLALHETVWNRPVEIYFYGFIFVVYVSKLFPILFLLLADIIRGLRYLLFKMRAKRRENVAVDTSKRITRSEFLKTTGLVSGGLLFSGLLVGMVKWAFDFKIHRHRVHLPNLPISFDGLRIVQISDIHLGSWASKQALRESIHRINELEPDLIFFTGDLVNSKTNEAFAFEEILAELKAPSGIYATLGNHDYGDYVRWPSKAAKQENMQQLYDLYRRLGWELLNNENRIFDNGDGKLAVIGVENWGDFGRFPKYGDLGKAIIGAEDAHVKLLLSHDPSHWDKVVTEHYRDIDITFAGHTHGFQFGIEIKNIKWSPAQYIYKHWAGMYERFSPESQLQRLYVNRGLGNIGYPGRVGILPEITLMELTKGA